MRLEDAMSNVAALDGASAKLLLRLIELGGATESPSETMQAAGISRPRYFAAKKRLRDLGLLRLDGTVVFGKPKPALIYSQAAPPGPEPLLATPPLPRADLPEEMLAPLPEWKTEYLADFTDEVETPSWSSRAAEADRMPDDGDRSQRSSNFQARRKAQLKVIQQAFADLFGQPLAATTAKELLRLAEESAEAVVDAFDVTLNQPKKIDFPAGYTKSVLLRQAKERPAPAAAAQPEPEFFLDKPSARTAKAIARLRTLKLDEDEEED